MHQRQDQHIAEFDHHCVTLLFLVMTRCLRDVPLARICHHYHDVDYHDDDDDDDDDIDDDYDDDIDDDDDF